MWQACQAQQEQNLLCNVDDKMEDFFNLESKERGSHSNVEPYACEEEEEGSKKSNNEKFPAEESQPNALQWSSTLQQRNVEQLSISCPD